jgi:hypothetical protein
MSVRRPQQRRRSLSSESESGTASEEEMEPRTARSRLQHGVAARGEGRRVFSQSTPALVNQRSSSSLTSSLGLDGTHHSTSNAANSSAFRSAHPHPPRTHSYGAVASHLQAHESSPYGGQTWVDFLRESGVDENGTRQSLGPIDLNMGPPPLPDHHSRPSSSRFTLPAHPSRPIEPTRREDRKRRLTTPESPLRRPSNTRMRADRSGSSGEAIVLDEPPLPALPALPAIPLARPSLTPTHSHPHPHPPTSVNRAATAVGPIRRESESSIVLPNWQPDAEVSHCPVCGSQFTFFYRKHHCRYVHVTSRLYSSSSNYRNDTTWWGAPLYSFL